MKAILFYTSDHKRDKTTLEIIEFKTLTFFLKEMKALGQVIISPPLSSRDSYYTTFMSELNLTPEQMKKMWVLEVYDDYRE
jgi:hypothetical protein